MDRKELVLTIVGLVATFGMPWPVADGNSTIRHPHPAANASAQSGAVSTRARAGDAVRREPWFAMVREHPAAVQPARSSR